MTGNYRKAKQIQHKANATSTNKVPAQMKGNDSKAFSQSKHKQEVPGKIETSRNPSKTTALNTTNPDAEATGRAAASSGSVPTPIIRPKTDPVPVPPSPSASS